jgi:hypothetical protein
MELWNTYHGKGERDGRRVVHVVQKIQADQIIYSFSCAMYIRVHIMMYIFVFLMHFMFLSITKLFYLDIFFAHALYLLPNKTTMPLFFMRIFCLDGNNNDLKNLFDNNEIQGAQIILFSCTMYMRVHIMMYIFSFYCI